MAFGADISETLGNVGNRTLAQGYNKPDEIRKQYTGYEHDDESNLDFAQARYYNSAHGRFTSVDPLTASANTKDPQTFNRYTYALNSPYKFTDPLGLISSEPMKYKNANEEEIATIVGKTITPTVAIASGETKAEAEPPPPPPPSSERQISVTGGTEAQRGEVNDSLVYLRIQSASVEAELSQYEGLGDGVTLEVVILEDAAFEELYNKNGLEPLAVAESNGEISTGNGKDVDDPAGYISNVRIVIKQSSIDVKQERKDRKNNNESQLEAILSHEIGHAKDIRTNPRKVSSNSSTDKHLPYQERRNERRADRFLKVVSFERRVKSKSGYNPRMIFRFANTLSGGAYNTNQ